MNRIVTIVLGLSLFMAITTYSFAEEKSGRYQLYSATVSTFDDKGGGHEDIVFLLDTETGDSWSYNRGVVNGTLFSLWSPIVPSDNVMDQTKELVGEATNRKMMEEARKGIDKRAS